jgi:predicted ATP-grasp superfamily ATP-dependent carboligase
VPTPLDGAHAHAGAWVVKPDEGAGAVDTRVHADLSSARDDLRQRQDAGRPATLEPWVEGEAMSMSLLAGGASLEALAYNRQDVAVAADGTLAWHGVRHGAVDPRRDPRAPRLHGLAAAVARAVPGLRGYVGIDFVWHPTRGPVVIEINPRLTSAYVGLSKALRRNLAAAVLALHAKEAG